MMYEPLRPMIAKAAQIAVANEWRFDPSEILNSPRKVRGKFHTPKIDKDNEYIEKTAVQTAVPDFMHLPILHDFHKERTVGIVTRVVELSDGSFDFEGLIKATDDCNDIWELIQTGNYDQVSIYGKRTCGSGSCGVRPEQRTEPCVTTGVRLDSISVCDGNARNDGTSLEVMKGGGKVVFTATEEIIKAETTDSSLMHTVTDYPKEKKCKQCKKGDVMDDEVDKGKFDSMGRNYQPPKEKEPEKVRPDSEKTSGTREANARDEKAPWAKKEGGFDFGKGSESIEAKLDQLEQVIQGLVEKDTEAKSVSDNNYSDKMAQPPTSGKDPEQEQLKPEPEREYGAPESSCFLDTEQKEEEKAGYTSPTGRPRITSKTSPEEVEHWKKLYEAGKAEYAARAARERDAPKEAYTAEATPGAAPDSAIDEKANPPWANQTHSSEDRGSQSESNEVMAQRTTPPRKPMITEGPSQEPPRPIPPSGAINRERAASHEQSSERLSPSEVKHIRQNPQAHAPFPNKPAGGKDAPYRASLGEDTRTPPKTEAMRRKEAKKETSDEGTEKPGEYGYVPEGKADAPEVESPVEDQPQGEMGDIESRIDRLIAIVAQLVQSDTKVHEGMEQKGEKDELKEKPEKGTISGQPSALSTDAKEQLRHFSKGTENMEDKEVDLLVKAKVDAKVDEITKAYQVSLDELKKANTDLIARIDAMEKQTIEKSGVAVILREGDEDKGTVLITNAAAVAAATKKAKV